jgi:hypothetical protein
LRYSSKQLAAIGIFYSLATAVITEVILYVFNLADSKIVLVYIGVTAFVTFVVPPRRFFGKNKNGI